jgi:uncharacterized protein (DUF697 family)/CRP-like cAMP-binding protein
MVTADLDLAAMLNRALDRATQNLTIDKLLLQIGLDPSNVTFHAIFQRLIDIAVLNTNFASMCALLGAGFYAATLLMRTMVPLRILGIISALFFMTYGALAGAVSTFLMYLLLLPINSLRLFQMRNLVKKARVAAQGDLSMDWLKPFMDRRHYRQGDVLFRKGQLANEMCLTVTGKFLVTEIAIELPPGRLMGELGFLTPNNRRTQTVECIENGEVLTITYDRLLEIYFQNPEFGYYFLRLSSDRLLQNIARLEGIIAAKPQITGPELPADSRASNGKSKTTMAVETTGSTEAVSDNSITAEEAIDSTEPEKAASIAVTAMTEFVESGNDGSIAAVEAIVSAEPQKDASSVATQTTSPNAIEIPQDARRANAMKIVERFSLWSGAAGVIPLPFVDLAAVGGIQMQMLRRISRIYSIPFSKNLGKALIASLAGSMLPASSGMGAASVIKSVPVVGTAISSIVMPVVSAGATYAIGTAFIKHFNSGGTLLDFNPPDYREFIKVHKDAWRSRSGPASGAAKSTPGSQDSPIA